MFTCAILSGSLHFGPCQRQFIIQPGGAKKFVVGFQFVAFEHKILIHDVLVKHQSSNGSADEVRRCNKPRVYGCSQWTQLHMIFMFPAFVTTDCAEFITFLVATFHLRSLVCRLQNTKVELNFITCCPNSKPMSSRQNLRVCFDFAQLHHWVNQNSFSSPSILFILAAICQVFVFNPTHRGPGKHSTSFLAINSITFSVVCDVELRKKGKKINFGCCQGWSAFSGRPIMIIGSECWRWGIFYWLWAFSFARDEAVAGRNIHRRKEKHLSKC